MKKILLFCTMILVIVLCPAISCYAAETNCENDIYNKIVESLSFIGEDAEFFEVQDINFSNLEITLPVSVYVYKSNTFMKVGEVYFLVYDGNIVATAYEISPGKFCIETYLARLIDKYDFKAASIIYDSDAMYVNDGTSFYLVNDYAENISDRDKINISADLNYQTLDITNLKITNFLNYDEAVQNNPNVRTVYSCNISYVSQLPYDYLCWAATIATIKNYLSGTSYNAATVAMQCLGTTSNFDQTSSPSQTATYMQNNYSLSYSYAAMVPSDNTILSNITNGYPIYGCFSEVSYYPVPGHAGTVYGINPLSGSILVSDPKYGYTTAYYSNGYYQYMRLDTYVTYALTAAICHTW